MTVATPFDRNAVRPGRDVDLDVPASSKKRTVLWSAERIKSLQGLEHAACSCIQIRTVVRAPSVSVSWVTARQRKVVPDREEDWTNCE